MTEIKSNKIKENIPYCNRVRTNTAVNKSQTSGRVTKTPLFVNTSKRGPCVVLSKRGPSEPGHTPTQQRGPPPPFCGV